MDKLILNYLDKSVLRHTGKHLDTLQSKILQGVLLGQKYSDIAKDYKCTDGHVRDKASELWKVLRTVLGEDINRGNLRAIVERRMESNFIFFNPSMDETVIDFSQSRGFMIADKEINTLKLKSFT
jgi:hypothetical protein